MVRLGMMIAPALGFMALYKLVLHPWVWGYVHASPPGELVYRLRFALIMLAIFVCLYASWGLWLGIRVLTENEWPLPGTFVLRPTPVQTGLWVRVRGISIVVLALAMMVNGILLIFVPELFFGK